MQTGTLDILGTLNAGVLQLCYENLLAAPATSVTISGLDGDVDEEYRLIIMNKSGGTSGNYQLQMNSDSTAANYGYQFIDGYDTSVSGARSTSAGFNCNPQQNTNSGEVQLTEINIKSKSGKQRIALVKTAYGIATSVVSGINLSGQTWTNTADNITNIKIVGNNSALDTGTHILLFKRTPIGSLATLGMRTGNITVAGTLSAGCMQKVYSTTLSSPASSVSISGVDGNTDILYELIIREVSAEDANYIYLNPNNDSTGGRYGYQAIIGNNTTFSGFRYSTAGQLPLNWEPLVNPSVGFSRTLMYAKTANVKTFITECAEPVFNTTITSIALMGGAYNETSTNITSLVINSQAGKHMGTGTHIELWALRKHS